MCLPNPALALALALLWAPYAPAAYVQFKDCFNHPDQRDLDRTLSLVPEALRATIGPNDHGGSQLELAISGRFPGSTSCQNINLYAAASC